LVVSCSKYAHRAENVNTKSTDGFGAAWGSAFFIGEGWVAQLVEQWTENPRVGGSIPPPATSLLLGETLSFAFCLVFSENAENERKCKFCISLASCHMLSSSSGCVELFRAVPARVGRKLAISDFVAPPESASDY
jgi:hypothetical protein